MTDKERAERCLQLVNELIEILPEDIKNREAADWPPDTYKDELVMIQEYLKDKL